jgi:hypothetical protein
MNFIVSLHGALKFNNGGVNVLLELARRLDQSGFQTKVYVPVGPNVQNPIFNKFATLGDVDQDTIAVYSEDNIGNILKANRIIRWVLLGAHRYEAYDKNEIIYYYLPFCKNNPAQPRLFLPYLPSDVMNRNEVRLYQSCYIVKKGLRYIKNVYNRRNIGCVSKYQATKAALAFNKYDKPIELDFIGSHEEIINIFNKTKYFVCYDPVCFLVIIALLCGCIVVQDPIDNYSESEWIYASLGLKLDRFPGIAYGLNNIDYAQQSIGDAPEMCMKLINSGNDYFDSFIRDIKHNTFSYEECYKFNDSPFSLQQVIAYKYQHKV